MEYLDEYWDYVIQYVPMPMQHVRHLRQVGKRLHIGFDDPSRLSGDANFIMTEFRRVRDEIKNAFARFYLTEIKKAELPRCMCE